MIAQIHDEVIFEVVDDMEVVKTASKKIMEIMSDPPLKDFPIPVPGEMSCGYKWGTKMTIEKWLEENKNV
jgi:DNA polymerase-1